MQQKTLICYSLNVALWFFGHNATTAMGQVVFTIHYWCQLIFTILLSNVRYVTPLDNDVQEDSTGMDTGMKEYLTKNHPELLDKLTPNSYDEIFVVPWATSRSALTIHDSSQMSDCYIMMRVRNTTKDKRQGV